MADAGGTPELSSVSLDREILCAFFDATNSPEGQMSRAKSGSVLTLQECWKRKGGWKSSKPMEAWHGVTTNAEGRVIGLKLDENNLTGVIPPELGGLVALEDLSLRKNALKGGIPKELGKLRALKELDLCANQLVGGIPEELGKLQALKKLSLSRNPLGGGIPPQLGNLGALQELRCHSNKLEGSIPRELGKMHGLKNVLLYRNNLDGSIPEELGNLGALERLGLSSNQLTGRIPAELGSLGALVTLQLENNHLTGSIPPALGTIENLFSLDLSDNQLNGCIPVELGNLGALCFLRLEKNRLTGRIPPQLGKLKALYQLGLSNNNLEGNIPAELGNLGALHSFHLEHNQLTGNIPPQLGNLHALGRLNVNNNLLKGTVPAELGRLGALHTLRLEDNQLTGLWNHAQHAELGQEAQGASGGSVPAELRHLLALLKCVEERGYLGFDNNPWAEPPEAVVKNGMTAVMSYYDDLYSEACIVRRNSVKVVLVGQEGAGKTSLCRSMKAGRATPTDGSTESTVFADVETLELNDASVRVYDCAGQVAYTGLLQMFLTPRAVCLVVCNAGAVGLRDGAAGGQLEEDIGTLEKLRVCDWMRSLSQRVPRSDVILVATKCDLAGENAADIARRIDEACQTWLAGWVEAGMAPVRLEDEVCLTSCFAATSEGQGKPSNGRMGEAWECDWREDMTSESPPSLLHRVVNKRDGSGLRGAEMMLPNSWNIALAVLDALEHGVDPVEAVVERSPRRDGGVESNPAASKPEPFKGITVEELKLRWLAVVKTLSENGIEVKNPGHALEGALSIREFEGTLVRHESFVFLDVIWLTRILKPLLNHRDTEGFNGKVFIGDTAGTYITLTDDGHIDSWNRLKEDGILEPELARVMWPDLFEYVLPTLGSLGLSFPLECDPEGGLVILLRLGVDRPDDVGKDIDAFRSQHAAVLSMCWDFFLGVPPGAIEKVLTRCCSVGGVQTFWRFGVLVRGAMGGSEGGDSFALVLEYSSDSHQLDMKVYGDICTVAPWAALAYAMSAVKTMAMEFPGLRSRAFLRCPQHGQEMLVANTASRPGDKLLRDRGCRRCSRQTRDVGAAAVEIVRMVDVRQARGVVFNEMKAKFAGLQLEYAVLRPADFQARPEQFETSLESFSKTLDRTRSTAASPGSRLGGNERDVLGGITPSIGSPAYKASETRDLRQDVNFLVTMVMAMRGDLIDTPRQACILPGNYAEPNGLSDVSRKPEVWMKRLDEWCQSDFKAGKGIWKHNMRLFLVCAHTRQLVPCGYSGRGYDVSCARKWVGKTAVGVKVLLQVALGTLAGMLLSQLPAAIFGVALEQIAESACTGLQARLGELGIGDRGEEAAGVQHDKLQALDGRAYEGLRKIVNDLEQAARCKSRAANKKERTARENHRATASAPEFVYFKQVMVKVQARTGDGEAQWVLKEHKQAWLDEA